MHTYFVSANEQITPSTLLLTLKKKPSLQPFLFQPGQYAAISFKRYGRPTAARCFSIVSSPTDQDVLQFSMRTKGRYTKALTTLHEGDKVKIRGAFGGFVFDADRDTDTVLFAGGIGITPFMSMIRYAAEIHLTSPIVLVFSCQNQDDVPFADELKILEARNPHFQTVFVIGQGPTDKFTGYNIKTGRITPELIDYVSAGSYKSKSFFICGPPPFMNAINKALKDKKTPAGNIMTEAFSQGPNRQTGKIRSWPFNMYALGAVGVVLGSFVVMVSDLLDILPPFSQLGSSSAIDLSNLTNTRQNDLDKLVNALPVLSTSAPVTDAVTQAARQSSSSAQTPTSTNTNTATKTSTPTPVVTTPAPVATPAPAYVPKCTTTQSGVTTCV